MLSRLGWIGYPDHYTALCYLSLHTSVRVGIFALGCICIIPSGNIKIYRGILRSCFHHFNQQ